MEVVYEEMSKLHHTVSPILAIHSNTKKKSSMLKQVIITLNNIHEWKNKYLVAPKVLPKKDYITTQNDKICIKVQSGHKIDRDVDRVLASYTHLLSGLESVIEVHRVPFIGESREVRKQEEILQEVQEFFDPFRQASNTGDLQVTKENITQYVVEPVRM